MTADTVPNVGLNAGLYVTSFIRLCLRICNNVLFCCDAILLLSLCTINTQLNRYAFQANSSTSPITKTTSVQDYKLQLNTLEKRRNRADLLSSYTRCRSIIGASLDTQPPFESLFQLTHCGHTEGHTLKLIKHCTNSDVSLHLAPRTCHSSITGSWNSID